MMNQAALKKRIINLYLFLVLFIILLIVMEIISTKYLFPESQYRYYIDLNDAYYLSSNHSDIGYISTYLHENKNNGKNAKLYFLGDSITDYYAVSGENYVELIQKKFSELKISNLGVPGYNLKQSITSFYDFGSFSNNSMIVLQYNPTDFTGTFVQSENKIYYPYPYQKSILKGLNLPSEWKKEIHETSLFFQNINNILIPKKYEDDFNKSIDTGVKRNYQILSSFVRDIQKNNMTLIVIIFPFLIEDYKNDYHYELYEQIRSDCESLGITYIDLTEIYYTHDINDLKRSPDDPIHPNEKGHRIAFNQLKPHISKYQTQLLKNIPQK